MPYILTYSAQAPFQGQEILAEELRRAEDYFDTLMRIRVRGRQGFRQARARYYPAIAELEAEREALEDKVFELRKITRKMRQKERRRTPVPSENLAAVKALYKEMSALSERLKPLYGEAKAALRPHEAKFKGLIDEEMARLGKVGPKIRGKTRKRLLSVALEGDYSPFWKATAIVQAEETRETHAARKVCGLCSGTYLLIEAQVKQSCKMSEPEPRHGLREELTPDELEGVLKRKTEGRAGPQVKHLTRGDLFTQKGEKIRFTPFVEDMTLSPRQRNRRRYTDVSLRLKGGWVTFRVLLHRDIPADVDVCQVWVKAERRGFHWDYELQLVVKSEAKRQATGQAGTVAMDLGWRRLGDRSVRVATFIPEHGGPLCLKVPPALEGLLVLTADGAEFRLPERHIADHSRVLRKAQDDVFNQVVEYVQKRRKEGTLPEWFQEKTAFIAQWRKPGKLVREAEKLRKEWAPSIDLLQLRDRWLAHCKVDPRHTRKAVSRGNGKTSPREETQADLFPSPDIVDAWLRGQGFTENEAFVLTLYLWKRKNGHLRQWTCDQKTKDGRWLKNVFRVLSRVMADNYNTLLLEKFDLRDVAECPDDFDDREDYVREANRQRHVSNTHTMREYLVEAFGKRVDLRKGVIRQPAAYTTQDCHLCHGRCKWPQAKELIHTCEHCGETWDQDYNACWNLLRLPAVEKAEE